MLPLLVLLGTIAGAWYLLIVRPQQSQQHRHGSLVQQLQVGDHVLTVGGIYGRVVAVGAGAVDVELNPGNVSRIATDAIARIVEGGTGVGIPLPSTEAQTPVTNMQQPPHEQYPYEQQQPQHYAAPQIAPMTSGFTPPPVPTFAPMAAPVTSAAGHVTLRAQVVDMGAPLPPAPILTPWADVAPRQPAFAPAVAPTAQPVAQHHVSPGFQLAHQQAAAQQYAQPQVQMQPPVLVQQQIPAAPTMQPAIGLLPSQQVQYPQQVAVAAQVAPAPAPEAAPSSRRSRAPEGMGSSLRLDDPSLADIMQRARNERSGLADEYRRMTAPLVEMESAVEAQPVYAPAPAYGTAPAQPGSLFAAAPPSPHGMPRPNIGAPTGEIDPAFAFQRPTPMAHHTAPAAPYAQAGTYAQAAPHAQAAQPAPVAAHA